MAKEKTYPELQEAAEVLGIAKNQKMEVLLDLIAQATNPATVGPLMTENKDLVTQVEDLESRLQETVEGGGDGLSEAIERIQALLDAQMDNPDIHSVPYHTGLANGEKLALAAALDETVEDEDLLKPVTQVQRRGGAPLMPQYQCDCKESRMYLTLTSKNGLQFRSGLTSTQTQTAEKLMKKLRVKLGMREIPAEKVEKKD